MNKFSWHDAAEWGFKAALAFAASGAGVAFMERFHVGFAGQTLFWPVYAVLVYWLIIREIAFARPQPAVTPLARVTVRFALEGSGFGSTAERERIHRLGGKLEAALGAAGVGAYDGDEFGEGGCSLFMVGPDPEAIRRIIAPLLREEAFVRGAIVELFAAGSPTALRTEAL